MAAPGISSVTGSIVAGATGIVVDGGGFGPFDGEVWLYENEDGSGNADQLTVDTWGDLQIVVDIPGSLNNSPGSIWLRVYDSGLNGSPSFAVTLDAAGGEDMTASGAMSITGVADLDGRTALVAAGALSIAGVADLDARGNMAAAGTIRITGSAELFVEDAISAAGALSITGSADLEGFGNLSAAGAVSIVGSAAVVGLVAMSAAGTLTITGSARMGAPLLRKITGLTALYDSRYEATGSAEAA